MAEIRIEHLHKAFADFVAVKDSIFTVRDGIPSALVSLPLRYMHSIVEMASLVDVQRVIDLLTAFVLALKPSDEFRQRL